MQCAGDGVRIHIQAQEELRIGHDRFDARQPIAGGFENATVATVIVAERPHRRAAYN